MAQRGTAWYGLLCNARTVHMHDSAIIMDVTGSVSPRYCMLLDTDQMLEMPMSRLQLQNRSTYLVQAVCIALHALQLSLLSR